MRNFSISHVIGVIIRIIRMEAIGKAIAKNIANII